MNANNTWTYTKNCSWFVVTVWNTVAPSSKKLSAGVIKNPATLSEKIKSIKGYATGKAIKGADTSLVKRYATNKKTSSVSSSTKKFVNSGSSQNQRSERRKSYLKSNIYIEKAIVNGNKLSVKFGTTSSVDIIVSVTAQYSRKKELIFKVKTMPFKWIRRKDFIEIEYKEKIPIFYLDQKGEKICVKVENMVQEGYCAE